MDEEITEVRRPPLPPGQSAAPVRPGAVLGHLRLDSSLARGPAAELFQAQNLVARKPCLVKVFDPSVTASRVRWGRYVHESKTVSSLQLPGIAEVYHHQLVEGVGLAVMGPSQGSPLRELLRSSGPLSRRAFVPLIRAIGLALAPVHAAGIAHACLHPGQVLAHWTGAEPQVQLLDFGVHHLLLPFSEEGGTQRPAEHAMCVAPEQAKGEAGDLRSDVYALAVLLYRMITGRPPFAGETFKAVLDQHLSEAPAPPSQLASTSPDLEQAILHALEKDPRKRTASVEALLAAIDPAAVTGQHLLVKTGTTGRQGLSPSASKEIELASLAPVPTEVEPAPGRVATPRPPPPPKEAELRVPRQRLWLFIALGAAVILCGGVLAYVFLGGDEQPAPTPEKRAPVIRRTAPAGGPTRSTRPAATRVPATPAPRPPAVQPAAAPVQVETRATLSRATLSRAGAARPTPAPPPPPGAAQLEVVSSDERAEVILDGQPRGRGRNVVIPGLLPGRHRVQLLVGGKRTPERQLLLKPGESAKVVF